MEEGKTGETESKVALRKTTLRDINYLLSKSWLSEQEVYNVIKNFLKSYLNLKYEFTKDELFAELKNVYLPYTIRADFFKFIDVVFMFEYADVKYSDKELKQLLEEFKNFLDYLLVPSLVKKAVNKQFTLKDLRKLLVDYLYLILKSKQKKVRQEPNETKKQETKLTNIVLLEPGFESHIDINSILEKIYFSIDNKDFDSARFLYKKVMNKYQFLSSDEKALYYPSLVSVYQSLTNFDIKKIAD